MGKDQSEYTPFGSQTLSKQKARFGSAWPGLAVRGRGPYLWTESSRKFIDWICGLAACPLGYRHPAVEAAVLRQLKKGVSFSLPTRLEDKVAEMLCDFIPCAEAVRFVKTGSESVEASIRIARMETGRDIIAFCEDHYNGWHSLAMAGKPYHPGVPKAYESMIRLFKYNDPISLVAALSPGDVAAVIMEPLTFIPPTDVFLLSLESVCHDKGTILIWDEMVTGARWPGGSAQKFYGVTPDLACFGKGIANGWPLACVVGRKDLMRHAWAVSGTFGGEAVSLAAARAALTIHANRRTQDALWRIGAAMTDGLEEQRSQYGLPVRIMGEPPRIQLKFDSPDAIRLMSLWLQVCSDNGVLFHPGGWTGSIAHQPEIVKESLRVTDMAFQSCANSLKTGDWSRLKEPLIEPIKLRG